MGNRYRPLIDSKLKPVARVAIGVAILATLHTAWVLVQALIHPPKEKDEDYDRD